MFTDELGASVHCQAFITESQVEKQFACYLIKHLNFAKWHPQAQKAA
jgi:hypothetical protein